MIPRLRTIAILMLLAGLTLGIFTSRALRSMGGADGAACPIDGHSHIEQRVAFYESYYRLDPQQTDRIRREFYRYDRLVRGRLWELRQQDAEWFRARADEAEVHIRAILEESVTQR